MVSALILSLTLAVSAANAHPGSIANLFRRQTAGSCRGQSCLVATVSGSTGATVYEYQQYPKGDTAFGDCCIVRYFPAAKDAIYANRAGLKEYCAANGGDSPLDSNPPGVDKVSLTYPPPSPAPSANPGMQAPTFPLDFPNPFITNAPRGTANCKPNILVYVKGSGEPGDQGITIGPEIAKNLDMNKWEIRTVNYDNTIDSNYCLGLPGGKLARGVLVDVANSCPNAKLALGGYSQGAMVVRHAIARAPAAVVARVKSVLTFGDPFLGAKIGQYSGPIHAYCDAGDGVCSGELNITPQHLGYIPSVAGAVALLNADVA